MAPVSISSMGYYTCEEKISALKEQSCLIPCREVLSMVSNGAWGEICMRRPTSQVVDALELLLSGYSHPLLIFIEILLKLQVL